MTTGVAIIGSMLRGSSDILAIVPLDRIKAGALPEGVALPAILVRSISSTEFQTLRREALTRTIDRVAVTVRAASYREQVALVQLIKRVCAGQFGDIGEGERVSILSAGIGPDLRGPGNSFEQTPDFKVSYDTN